MSTVFTIIIPHYNSPNSLQHCLDSIPVREDIQVIVVDDCSNPDIVDFQHLPGTNRLFTEIYKTPVGGSAGRARNMGLDHARGEWLIFADADDYFEPGAFDVFDQHSDDTDDIIFFGACSRIGYTLEQSDRDKHTTNIINQYLKDHDESGLRFHYFVPWSKMIRRTLVNQHNIRFDEVRWANDVMFSVKIGYCAKNIKVVPDIVYCITVTKGSLFMQQNKQSLLTRYEIQLQRNLFLREHGLEKYELSIMQYLRKSLQYGWKTFWQFIQIGRKYNAHFFIGASQWIKNAFLIFIHSFRKDKKKEYVTH